MGLFVSTTGSDVVITELGITIVHPTTDYEISDQFTAEEIKGAVSLTTTITNGTLEWRKSAGGGAETPADYDPDFLDIEREHTGTGAEGDQTATKTDLVNIQQDDSTIVSDARILNFEGATVADEGGNKATVTIAPGDTSHYLPFGEKATPFKVASGYLEVPGGARVGYKMPAAGSLTHYAIKCDNTTDSAVEIHKNGSMVDSYTLVTESEKNVNVSPPVAFAQGDIINVWFDDGAAIYEAFECDANTLFLAPIDGDVADDRQVTNVCSNMLGNPGRGINGVTAGATGKFSNCIQFVASTDEHLRILHQDRYNVQDCTVEFWMKSSNVGQSDKGVFVKNSGSDNNGDFRLWVKDAKLKLYLKNGFSQSETTDVLTVDTWHHIACVFGTGGFYLYVDGVQKFTDSTTQGLNGNTEVICLGCDNDGSVTSLDNAPDREWQGYIDELRISNTRRYTTGFTPPSSAFTPDANTVGLWHFDESSGAKTFADSCGKSQHAMMQASGSFGSIVTSPVKYGTHALSHTGSANDWTRLTHHPDMELSTVTFEGWFRSKDTTSGIIFQKGTSSTEGGLIVQYDGTNERIQVDYYGSSTSKTVYSSDGSMIEDYWTHISVAINSSYLNVYLNGVLVDSVALDGDYSNVMTNNTEDLFLGVDPAFTLFSKMYFDDFRVSDIVRDYDESNIQEISVLVKV